MRQKEERASRFQDQLGPGAGRRQPLPWLGWSSSYCSLREESRKESAYSMAVPGSTVGIPPLFVIFACGFAPLALAGPPARNDLYGFTLGMPYGQVIKVLKASFPGCQLTGYGFPAEV